jgi:hypothetical protein
MEGMYAALVVLGLLIAVLWIILPFAVFGIKSRLDRTNALLDDIKLELRQGQQASITELIELRRRAGS